MVWGIVACAVIVLGLGAWAGTGRLGEMPELVGDRPRGRIPAGPVNDEFVRSVRFPRAAQGYRRDQVDAHLQRLVAGPGAEEPVFDVVPGGYDMLVVDEALARTESELAEPVIIGSQELREASATDV